MEIPMRRRYGTRQLHQTLDQLPETTPDRLYATIPRTSDVAGGFLDVSCSDISCCANFMADWIATVFGCSKPFDTLCYMGIPDLQSVVIFFAAVKCGYKVIFPSPRNPASTNASLLEQTHCKMVIHVVEVEPVVNPMDDLIADLQYLQCPSFQSMLAAEPVSFNYPQTSWGEAKNNPIVVLHSSGSTGIPRPITMTHASFRVIDNDRNIPQVPGRVHRDFSMCDFPGGGKFYDVFPYFHLAGFLSNIVCPTFSDAASPVIGPPLQPPSSDLLRDIMNSQQLKALYIPPSIAERLINEPGSMDLLKKLDFVSYAGAPFSPEVGNKLLEITSLISLYGTTEGLGLPQLVPPAEAWDYLQ